jgi:hypothetical protein
MPHPTKAQTQSDAMLWKGFLRPQSRSKTPLILIYSLMKMSLIAEDNSEILELSALNWITIAEEMANTGFRGAYNLIPKSADFFSVCLRAPDRQA